MPPSWDGGKTPLRRFLSTLNSHLLEGAGRSRGMDSKGIKAKQQKSLSIFMASYRSGNLT